MRARGLAGGERDELDAAVRVERKDERLRERRESADERLVVPPIRQTLVEESSQRHCIANAGRHWTRKNSAHRSRMAIDAAPVVDEADDDEHDHHQDFN